MACKSCSLGQFLTKLFVKEDRSWSQQTLVALKLAQFWNEVFIPCSTYYVFTTYLATNDIWVLTKSLERAQSEKAALESGNEQLRKEQGDLRKTLAELEQQLKEKDEELKKKDEELKKKDEELKNKEAEVRSSLG